MLSGTGGHETTSACTQARSKVVNWKGKDPDACQGAMHELPTHASHKQADPCKYKNDDGRLAINHALNVSILNVPATASPVARILDAPLVE